MRYQLIIAYDGTNYCGWQVQTGKTSIQKLIQTALETFLRCNIDLTGSGRTDAGVHAEGQSAHFECKQEIDPQKLKLALNGLLPIDIRILDINKVPPEFHARYSAKAKIYHYYLHLDKVASPFERLYRFHVFKRLDLDQLRLAANAFLGSHDFTSFANEPQRGAVSHDPIRTLTRLDVHPIQGGVRLEFEADGFLYKMVRNIVGTLIECASGRTKASDIPLILAAKDRRRANSAAPAQGLFLHRVVY